MNPIDLASDWLEKRNCAYLAKENVVVYYDTTTGRKQDFQWITMTLVEVVRIIKATLMNPDDSDELKSKHVIAACQELDRVFEFGVRTRHMTKPTIFNYTLEADESLDDSIAILVSEAMYNQGFFAVLMNDVYDIMNETCIKLNNTMTMPTMRNLIDKHFPTLGYEVRTGPYRPQYNGKKQSAVMLKNSRPRDIVQMSGESIKNIANFVAGDLR